LVKEGNLYIEGDNLIVLKKIQEQYKNKIRMIYIDPPYNTGNDFVYNDSYKDWEDMISPRLELCKNLLSDNGVIFISIGEEEVDTLKKVCNKVFGKENFITKFVYEKTQHFGRQKLNAYSNAEYILCYARELISNGKVKELLAEKINTDLLDAPLYNVSNRVAEVNFPAGSVKFNLKDGVYTKTSSKKYELLENVTVKNGVNSNDFTLRFRSRWSAKTVLEEYKKGTTFWIKTDSFAIRAVYHDGKSAIVAPKQIIFTNPKNPTVSRFGERVTTSETATAHLEKLMGGRYFSYPKAVSLISYLISLIYDEKTESFPNDFTVLDFFSGSGTTAHACMHLNSLDNGKRRFILVQKPEPPSKNSLASKKGYKTICGIGMERIKKAGEEIKKVNPKVDTGFKVLMSD
jgi:adenine-specific DNA-methyltransferase